MTMISLYVYLNQVLHYAQELFEGMKAYRGVDNEIRMFRPMHNMTRMLVSARRSCLPEFDPHELVQCIRRLIQIDQEWVPHSVSSSLYIRYSINSNWYVPCFQCTNDR